MAFAFPYPSLSGRDLPRPQLPFLGYVLFVLGQIPVALGHDAPTVLIFRFLGGVTSSVCPAITGGWLVDFLLPAERCVAVAIFAATTLMGPSIGAIASQIQLQTPMGWPMTAWTTMVLGMISGVLGFIILPKTYLSVVEQRHARKLRQETKDWALHSRLDERPPISMLVSELILLSMTIYISFTFCLIYLLFVVYPISFVQERAYDLIDGTLPLLSICLGIIVGAFYASWSALTKVKRKAAKGNALIPEDRLCPMIVGAILAGIPIGVGVQVILLQSLAYLTDIYTTGAASATQVP
ncbi:major facilitator superfamily domain-containing protein [Aspergillus tetrazonus]